MTTPPTPPLLDFTTRKALLFALSAQRLALYYEHGVWMTPAQGASQLSDWLSRYQLQMPQTERLQLAEISDDFARQITGALSREAGLYTSHEMNEALDPNYHSPLAQQMLFQCECLLQEHGLGDTPQPT
ncbi:hypothetical protein [Chitinimonas sp.]|uniref:hypothetical protein n=1 Tax=Chitinimonas sp. TaxID=1934313 RepID=UPI002F9519C0